MAKDKTAKPLFAVKGDFYKSLDAAMNEAIFFIQQVETALDLDQIKTPDVAKRLRERCDAFRKAILSE